MAFKAKRRISFDISGRRGLTVAVFVAVLVLGLGIGIFAIDRNLKMNVGAQGVVLTLLGPANNTFTQVGGEFDVDVYLDTKGERVTAADLKVKYDKNIFEAKSISGTSFLPTVLTQGAVDNNNGIASIVLGAEPSNPVSGNAVVAKLRLKLKSNNQSSATISIDNSSAVAAVGSDSNVVSNYGSLNLNLLASSALPMPSRSPLPPIDVTPTPVSTDFPIPTKPPFPMPSRSPLPPIDVTPTPRPGRLLIDEAYLTRNFLVFKGPNLGGVGKKNVKIRYLVYLKSSSKEPQDETSNLFSRISAFFSRRWVTHEGVYVVSMDGEKEKLEIPWYDIKGMELKNPYEVYIDGKKASIRIRGEVPLPTLPDMSTKPPFPMPSRSPLPPIDVTPPTKPPVGIPTKPPIEVPTTKPIFR